MFDLICFVVVFYCGLGVFLEVSLVWLCFDYVICRGGLLFIRWYDLWALIVLFDMFVLVVGNGYYLLCFGLTVCLILICCLTGFAVGFDLYVYADGVLIVLLYCTFLLFVFICLFLLVCCSDGCSLFVLVWGVYCLLIVEFGCLWMFVC